MPLHMRWSSFRTSFQFKLFFIFTLLTLLISTLLSTLYVFSEIRKSRRFATERLQLRTQYLADSIRLPLYAENRAMLLQLAELATQGPEIQAVIISTPDNRVLADVHSSVAATPDDVIVQTAEVHSSPLIDSVESSITGGQKASTALIGRVRMERGTADLARSVRQVVLISSGIAVVFWLTVSLLCYLILRRLTHSFNALMHGIDALQGGNYTSRITIDSDDEPGRAARAVNNLASELLRRGEENSRLQHLSLDLERQILHTQKLESLGIMAGGIAHDFNNLLQSIIGNIELAAMKLEPDSAPQKLIINAINSGKRAAHLTDLMLAYTGKRFIAKKRVNLNELVSENAEMFGTAATSAVSTELNLFDGLPLILADEANIQQVVMNLITNAAESITEQPGIIKITTGIQSCDQTALDESLLDEKPAPGRFVFLEVSDNGCGMDEQTLKRVFDPFFTTKFTGRGLGMSAVMGILRAHNCALFVKSAPGKGTSFRALFPVSDSAPLPAATKQEITLPECSFSGVALVVDDEKAVLKVCSKMVEHLGFTVISACDGIDSVAKFREHADEISVVLMDLTMPNMDGLTAMCEIYAIRPDTKVIIASGFNKEELTERITGQAPFGFIRKPYSVKILAAELQRVMQATPPSPA